MRWPTQTIWAIPAASSLNQLYIDEPRIDEPGHRKKKIASPSPNRYFGRPILREKSCWRGLLVHSRSLSRTLAPTRPWSIGARLGFWQIPEIRTHWRACFDPRWHALHSRSGRPQFGSFWAFHTGGRDSLRRFRRLSRGQNDRRSSGEDQRGGPRLRSSCAPSQSSKGARVCVPQLLRLHRGASRRREKAVVVLC